jgi:RNA polymerase sigma-70 factor (ECF subfamily)
MKTTGRRWLKNENRLIARYVKHRDEQAFAELYGYYQPILLRFASRYVNDDELGAELTQDAFLRIARHLHRFDRKKSFATWAFTITANLCKNHLRSRSRRGRQVILSDFPEPDRSVAFMDSRPDQLVRLVRKDELARVDRAIRRLPPEQQEIIEMRLYDDVPYEAMAEIVGIPVGTVKSRLSRAKIGVRNML